MKGQAGGFLQTGKLRPHLRSSCSSIPAATTAPRSQEELQVPMASSHILGLATTDNSAVQMPSVQEDLQTSPSD
jgi:hypothetical protein